MLLILHAQPRRQAATATLWCLAATILLAGSPVTLHGQNADRQVPVDSLIFDLKNPDPVRRKQAAMSLGNNKVQRAVPDLVAAAGDKDAVVRREIVIALEKMTDIRALPAFVELSGDTEKDIRDRCIQSIVSLYIPKETGITVTMNKVANFFNPWSDEYAEAVVEPGIEVDPHAVTAMRDRLQDTNEGIRAKAARGLGILKANTAVPALVDTVRQDSSNSVRFEAIRSLRKISDVSAGKELIPIIASDDPKLRNEAVFTLGRFRCREAVPDLTSAYESQNALPAKKADKFYQQMLLDALAFIGDPGSGALFLKETKSTDPVIRLHAYEGMARVADPAQTTEISRTHVNEKDPKIRVAQAYALFRLGRREYLDEIVKALDSKKTSAEAREYLVELKPEDLPDLYAETKFQEQGIREGIAEILGVVGDSRAIPVLQELGTDHRGQISALCNQAIRRVNARTGG
jgi:HEAT repeat protein